MNTLISRVSNYFHRKNPDYPISGILYYDTLGVITYSLLHLVYDYRVHGSHNIPAEGPVLLVANHQSHLDPPILGCATKRQMYYIARATLFNNPLFACLIKSLRAISLDQSKGDSAAIKMAIEHLKKQRVVGIYPEGSRSEDGALGEFKPGVGLLIKRAKAPVVPVAIEGSFDIWQRHLPRPKLHGRIRVHVGKLIEYEVLQSLGPRGALEYIKERIECLRLEARAELRHTTYGQYPPHGPGDWHYKDPDKPKFTDSQIKTPPTQT